MGMNSVAVICNDNIHELEQGGQFGQRLADAIRTHGSKEYLDGYFGAGRIVSMAHADYPQIVVVHGNTGYSLFSKGHKPDPVVMKIMADYLEEVGGYKVRRPKLKK